MCENTVQRQICVRIQSQISKSKKDSEEEAGNSIIIS